MRKFVMVDVESGFVWGSAEGIDAVDACRELDRKLGEPDREYTDIGLARFDGRPGYHVHEAPAGYDDGGHDGQDERFIIYVEGLPLAGRIAFAGPAR